MIKGLIIGGCLIFALVLGLIYPITKSKPLWWKLIASAMLFFTIIFTFTPYIAGNFKTFTFISQNIENFKGPILFSVQASLVEKEGNTKNRILKIYHPQFPERIETLDIPDDIEGLFEPYTRYVGEVSYDIKNNRFVLHRLITQNPMFVLPLVPQLGEQIRIMNFHVPMAWVAVLSYLFAMFFGFKYLKTRDITYDSMASSSIYLGTLFTILATVTGMIWAKFNWGTFWNWDPRQTTIFVLMLIYFAYFVLRQSIDNNELRARLSSVYSIVAFVTVPFLVFILPRLLEGNHPGSANDTTAGPIISPKEGTLSLVQTVGFALGLSSFTLLYFWILTITVKINLLLNKFKARNV